MACKFQPPAEGYRSAAALKKGLAWCPYCGTEKSFIWDNYLGVSRCPDCGISIEDFYVRVCNRGEADAAGKKNYGGLCNDTVKNRFEQLIKGSGKRRHIKNRSC